MTTYHKHWYTLRKRWQLNLFMLLPLAYLLIFCYYPMLGAQIAFRNYTATGGIWESAWVGLKHFARFFESYQFARVVGNTLKLALYALLVNFPMGILFALIVNTITRPRLKKIVQTISYMPHFISVVVLVGIINQLLNPVSGVYGSLYRLAGFSGYPNDLLAKASAFPHLYVWSEVWQQVGWNSIVYLAALSSVSPELHEAAQIDGADRFARVLHVDLPAILPLASIMLIMKTGNLMSLGYEKVYLMQNNANLVTSEVISTYVYKTAMKSGGNFSYATAIGLFNSIVNCVLLLAVNTTAKRLSGEDSSLW